MSRCTRHAIAVAALVALAACSERPTPLAPHADAATPGATAAAGDPSGERSRHERLARRFALALADPGFRNQVLHALEQSKVREGKIHLQRFLYEGGGARLHQLAELASDSDNAVAADLDASLPIEVYLPVPSQRRGWHGDAALLVATEEADHEAPVAFDTRGRRSQLDPDVPPTLPVIALERAEVNFESGPALVEGYDTDPDKEFVGSGTGTGSGTVPSSPGLWMTYSHIDASFEGWLKGAPEFEIHMLGQDGGTTRMRSYQCAGESAGAPYEFNQDEHDWSGNVMLFSQAQLDSYKAEHPGQALRILVLEDDDTRCVIKTDSSRVAKFFSDVVSKYGSLTGGKDTLISVKTFRKATTLLSLFTEFWSAIQTPDDIVGTAIEDAVAGEYFTGANWIIKGENTVTHGALRLEMR
jgi:hypothetical protein